MTTTRSCLPYADSRFIHSLGMKPIEEIWILGDLFSFNRTTGVWRCFRKGEIVATHKKLWELCRKLGIIEHFDETQRVSKELEDIRKTATLLRAERRMRDRRLALQRLYRLKTGATKKSHKGNKASKYNIQKVSK